MEKQNQVSDRRRLIRKLVSLAALGSITSLLLEERLPKVTADTTDGSVAFYSSGSTTGDNSQFFWNDTNHRLGIGTNAPAAMLHVSGTTPNILLGDSHNSITSGVVGATIAGGGGGGDGVPGGNKVTDDYGTVGGGRENTAGNDDGTTSNRPCATVSGGYLNTASGPYSTVGGGDLNTASHSNSTVGGGLSNTASGYSSTVGGGASNTASGNDSTVPGGQGNTAGADWSFAAGVSANVKSAHHGAMLFSDDSSFEHAFNSAAADEFAVRATGGFRFVTGIDGSGNPTVITTIKPNGNVGLGTSSPAFPLHIAKAGNVARFGNGAGAVGVQISGAVANTRALNYMSGGSARWVLRCNGTAESGSNLGSDFQLDRYSDTGTGLGAALFVKRSTGNVGVGTTSPNAAALLDVSSTTKGFLPPRMATTQRNAVPSPPAGLMIFNTTTKKLNFYDGTAWREVMSS